MDFLSHFRREVGAFEAAVRRAAEGGEAPFVPSCPGWTAADLVAHLGGVHRGVFHVIDARLTTWPGFSDPSVFKLPADMTGWPRPDGAPNVGPLAASLVDWFAEGAEKLAALFGEHDPAEAAWTWSREQTVGFWLRVQAIEAAVHRWDAEAALGAAEPLAADLARDAVGHTFEVMAPARRAWRQAPPGAGERFGFRQTDGDGAWTVTFDGDRIDLAPSAKEADVEVAGTASDLALFLWHRRSADELAVRGDRALLDRYFELVPPV
ncbi:maleylpyruvate isomerase family mycothiol-dependent enzyme [Spongiactinospora sp. TRM90649]|uniref:maleylpyruvate isomerase family mycothiol-dependent enzyme n=1 Tax=Spongiactinospora sp. TRM90649 TaxID=3031114 RepID=UPI0023F7A1C1|nr:maleylpyruvate isomerase family mycothiol-dependent enzyme [Spongiactinospora sp. TRM90649]MDF5751866.1 maleylpyruvate isomerase family mycothiol-dependent enzyme [Spongiactinospora sp. TRM90649]